jgi:hypothetical protein
MWVLIAAVVFVPPLIVATYLYRDSGRRHPVG